MRWYAGGELPTGMSKEDVKFIYMHKTTRSRATVGLAHLERNYLAHAFNMSSYQQTSKLGKSDQMWEYLNQDPWGTTPRPHEDRPCWDSQKITEKYQAKGGEEKTRFRTILVPSQFYKDYMALQNKYYNYLRASLPLYMDQAAHDFLKEALEAQERAQEPPLDGTNKLVASPICGSRTLS